MPSRVKSKDLFESAFLLSSGCQLEDIEVTANRGRPTVIFLLKGDDAETACNDYRYGRAVANVTNLKNSLNQLKDLMFTELRKTGRKQYIH